MVHKNKAKGTKYENELYDLLVGAGYRCIRSAGSGTKTETNLDILAGKSKKIFGIEVKSCKGKCRYIDKGQIEQFLIFSEIFGANPAIAGRFNRQGWFFLSPQDLEDSGKNWALSLKRAKEKGKRFSQFFE